MNWTDGDAYEPRPRTFEEAFDLRSRRKQLVDCELPDGFELLTDRPRQFWIGQQMVWGFRLGWTPVGWSCAKYLYVARYEMGIADEPQMHWALNDFRSELLAAGEPVGEVGTVVNTGRARVGHYARAA